jgi:hypothetical protein
MPQFHHGALLLNAATATGAGTAVNLLTIKHKFGFQVSTTGSPTSVVCALQGSIDGTNWFTLATWNSATQSNGDIVFAIDVPVGHVRANLTTLSGGATPKVTAYVAPV